MSKISLQMYTLRNYTTNMEDLDRTLSKLKEIGFEMLQYSIPGHFDPKEVKKLFDKYNMRNDSVFCPCLFLEEKASDVVAQCEMFDTDYVRIESLPAGLATTAAGYKMFAHYLNEVTKELKKNGKKLLYHFHAFEFIRFGDTTGIEILLNESDPEVVQIIPDTHWIHSGGKSITDFLTKYKDRYDYVHTKDFAIGQIGATWEARPIEFAPVGEGNLDWKPIIDLCKSNNVKSFAIEQDDCYGKDEFLCVKSSFDFLKKMGVDE